MATGGMATHLLPQRYTDPELIARGGMGEVYRATDSVLQRPVAVKVLSERHASEPEVRVRFEREALAAARLSGERHVVTVFDVGEHDDRPFIVMEYLDGGSIQDRLREGPVTQEQALRWLGQTAEALDRAHARRIVHRDVKPANLLLDGNDDVVVTDFGIASAAGLDTLTLPGTVLGTAGYLSPEQASGAPATPASDRYALAVLAFELLAGRRPFASDTSTTEAYAHVNAPPPLATSVNATLPPAVDAVFARALAKDPAARPETSSGLVDELREALRQPTARPVAASTAPTVVQQRPATYSVVRSRRRPPARTPLIFAAIALVAAGVVVAALIGATGDGDQRGNRAQGDRTTQAQSQPTQRQTTRQQTTTQEQTTEEQTTTQAETTQPPETTPPPATTQPPETTQPPPQEDVSGAALNDQGYSLMQRGDYANALPLFETAVRELQGSGSLAEAYASYNLAYTRFQLGRCDGVLPLLDRSENVQGERREINTLYERAYARCVGDDD